ncbi:MAG: response regulator transcription factor [Acetobacteraceae bacterium]|nr:response regulator transcription factor [Acetobacteraceae bacterium]
MTPPHPVLIVDGNDRLRTSLAEQLAFGSEFTATGAASIAAADALIRADGNRFAAMLLDLGLPDGSAREFCAKLRRSGLRMPIIILAGAAGEAEVLRCLDAGANDAITKPLRMQDLIGKLRAQIARAADGEGGVCTIGPYEFRPAAKLLQEARRGRKIRLTEKETAILTFLLGAGGQPVSREILLSEVWGYNSKVTTHTLETHIYRLRQKIEPNPAEARILLTDAGGYRLEAG